MVLSRWVTLPQGGRYSATVYPDGSADLHGIPCFAECKARSNGANPPFDVTREWLEMAYRQHMQHFGGNYLPPAHTKHHYDPTAPTRRAGFFAMKGVGRAVVEGSSRSAIYCDILRIPPAVFAQIERGEWPYCSVEVGDWRRGIINSLALLDDEAPAHKFPLITVGQKQAAAAPAARFRSASVGRLVFKFAAVNGANMDPNQMPPGMPAPAAPPAAPMAAPAAPPAPGAPGAAPAAPGMPDPAALPPWGAALIAGIVQGIKSAIGEDEQTSDPDNEPPSAEPEEMGGGDSEKGAGEGEDKADFSANGAATMNAEIAGQFAAMRAELADLKADKKKREQADRVHARFSAALADLAEFNVDSETRADLATFAAINDNGAALKKYVAGIKRHAISDPPESLEHAGFGSGRTDPPEVASFAGKGPDALAKARAWHPLWVAGKQRGASASFENFVAAQDEAGISAQATTSTSRRGK